MLKSVSRIAVALTIIFTCYAQTQSQEAAAPTPKPKVKVHLAGVGPEPQFQILLDGLTDFLVEKKVAARPMDGESKSRTSYIDRLSSLGGESLLYITLDIAEGQVKDTLLVQCFDPTGKLLWEEKAKGSIFSTSASGVAKSMLKSMKKKLEPRIGKEGLPVE
jgi:hypothetical protein